MLAGNQVICDIVVTLELVYSDIANKCIPQQMYQFIEFCLITLKLALGMKTLECRINLFQTNQLKRSAWSCRWKILMPSMASSTQDWYRSSEGQSFFSTVEGTPMEKVSY